LAKNDDNLLENQRLNYFTQIVLLESFLINNNFDYKFINWDLPIKELEINKNNIIDFDNSWKDKFVDSTSHPTTMGCQNISEVIYDCINK
jgi:hypothetical protein